MPPTRKKGPRSIATRTGDDGTTALLFGRRVAKSHPRIEAVGSLDELNAALGFAKATATSPSARAGLSRIQQELVALMGEVACSPRDAPRHARSNLARIDAAALARLDAEVAAIESRQPPFDGWATPGANVHAAALELARTIARRAERRLVALGPTPRKMRPLLLHYLNRLSDLLWLKAREAEQARPR